MFKAVSASALRGIVVLGLVLGLAACGHGTKSERLAQAVRAAMASGPSESAFDNLDEKFDQLAHECDRVLTIPSCQSPEFVEVKKWALNEMSGMLLAGAEKGEAWAIRRLFSLGQGDVVTPALRQKAAVLILEAAKQDDASAAALLQAGRMYTNGVLTQQDFTLARASLEKAWQKGAVSAAGDLAALAEVNQDSATAYLWAVRCVKPCSAGRTLEAYLEPLTPEEVTRIQKVARDHSVLTISYR
ncbi:TPA: hypothetical protein L4F62_004119 [Pseudomonas aeruginosa]|uniref:hypothetical protein n=1 Tax=Pseudomonas aeruginosa TaxID=287 RepID=UPI0024B3CA53|nr:hypothetical protein [Pseudomonas aeruginosa]CAI9794603.1 Sel1 repeat family protein [Pseudomonas aeruginosa]CAI9911992.1 Sel1 repeat family protein [Pseudomonas aeruginosa]HBO1617614.1 hypothetical protein [Pseudomonas aeruginosa]HBO9385117.1 hypothetical protein [Pseudomonas aeruginosa]